MSTYDNAAPLDGWALPRRCCGTWADDLSCAICGQWVPLKVPANVELGSE